MASQVLKGIQSALLIAAYPLIIYLLLSNQLAWIGAMLVLGLLVWKLRHRANGAWLIALLLVGVLIVARLFGVDTILKLSPLLIHSSLFTIFAHSLKTTPMIERFARLDFDVLPPGIAAYCRKLTLLWAGFFAANIIGGIALAIWGDDASWALYNGLIVYLLIGALLLGEYLWRRIAFPELEIPPLAQTMRSIASNGHTIWAADRHDAA